MIVDLPNTTTAAVSKKLVRLRQDVGAMTLARVLTLVIITDNEMDADPAIEAANDASRQHPCRIIALVGGDTTGASRLDAQIRVGGDAGAGEVVVLRLHGALAEHGDSVLIPLLLADSPVVAWWPKEAPPDVAATAIGQMAQRRVTDSAEVRDPRAEIRRRAEKYHPGDTDLAWARITLWRGLLAAALDQPPYEPVVAAVVAGAVDSPSADLLAGWLAHALRCPVTRLDTKAGTGMTSVRLERRSGNIDLLRPRGDVATLAPPGQPVRRISLGRRELAECLADELRRLDPDEIYQLALTKGLGKVTPHQSVTASDPAIQKTDARKPAATKKSALFRRPTDKGHIVTRGPTVVVHRDKQLLADAAAARLVTAIVDAQSSRGEADIVLTGGSMGTALLASLGHSPARDAIDWRRLNIWWGDERFLPAGDPERNETQALESLLDAVPLDPARVHPMPGSDGPDGADVDAAASRYAEKLAGAASPGRDVPEFDVLMLGVGPDAHVASLFPEHPALHERDASVIGVRGAPKPPPTRLSMTLPSLCAARDVWFLVSGADKAGAVGLALSGAGPLQAPAAGVSGTRSTTWLLDRDAATHVPKALIRLASP